MIVDNNNTGHKVVFGILPDEIEMRPQYEYKQEHYFISLFIFLTFILSLNV